MKRFEMSFADGTVIVRRFPCWGDAKAESDRLEARHGETRGMVNRTYYDRAQRDMRQHRAPQLELYP